MPQGPIAGTATIKVDGNMYPLKGNLTVSGSPLERTGIAGQDYVHGYQELPRVPYIECDLSTCPRCRSKRWSRSPTRPSRPI